MCLCVCLCVTLHVYLGVPPPGPSVMVMQLSVPNGPQPTQNAPIVQWNPCKYYSVEQRPSKPESQVLFMHTNTHASSQNNSSHFILFYLGGVNSCGMYRKGLFVMLFTAYLTFTMFLKLSASFLIKLFYMCAVSDTKQCVSSYSLQQAPSETLLLWLSLKRHIVHNMPLFYTLSNQNKIWPKCAWGCTKVKALLLLFQLV